MRTRTSVCLLALLGSSIAIGQTKPATPAQILEDVNTQAYSGAVYYATLHALGIKGTLPAASTISPAPGPDNPTGIFTTKATDDPYQEVEPAIGTVAVSGARYVTTAFMRYLNANSPSRIATRATTDVYSGFPYAWTLAIPDGFTWSGDPSLAANDSDSGQGPRRLYCGGMVFNDTEQQPSSIVVWQSDTGGTSWSGSVTVATSSNPNLYFLDKPSIGVSGHAGSKGYVYVVWVQRTFQQPNQATIYFARSTNGGTSFTQGTAVVTGNVGGPQVAADPSSGTVYVVWADYNGAVIASKASSNYGDSFGGTETVPGSGPYLLGPPVSCSVPPPTMASGMRAFTLPTARFNAAAGTLAVVWHERESAPQLISCSNPPIWTTPPTNVYFAYRDGGGWHQKVLVNMDFANTDQFMPAVVADPTGDVIITWYDTRDDGSRGTYKPFYTYSSFQGTRLMDDFRFANFASNPGVYPFYFIGDYQDVALLQSVGIPVFVASWVGIESGVGNIYVSRAQ